MSVAALLQEVPSEHDRFYRLSLVPLRQQEDTLDSLVPDRILSKLAPPLVLPLFRLLQVVSSPDELDPEHVIVLLGVLDGVVQVGGESTQVGLIRSATGERSVWVHLAEGLQVQDEK